MKHLPATRNSQECIELFRQRDICKLPEEMNLAAKYVRKISAAIDGGIYTIAQIQEMYNKTLDAAKEYDRQKDWDFVLAAGFVISAYAGALEV